MKMKISYKKFFIMLAVMTLMIRKFAGVLSLFSTGQVFLFFTFVIPFLILFFYAVGNRIKISNLLILVLGIVTYVTSRDDSFLFTILLIHAWRDESPLFLIRFWFYIQSAVLTVCIAAYGILYSAGSDLARVNVMDGRLRYYFMFDHPNNFSVQLFFCLLAFVYLYEEVVSRSLLCLILILASFFLYMFPKTYTAAIMTIFLMILLLITWHLKKILKVLYGLLIGTVCIIAFGSVGVIYSGRSAWVSSLFQGSFYSRISNAAVLIRRYPVTLFGRQLDMIGRTIRIDGEWNIYWLDMAYIRVFMAYGIFVGALFVFVLFRSLMRMAMQEKYMEAMVLAVIAVYALSEWSAFSISTSWGLIFLWKGLRKRGWYLRIGKRR